MLHWPVTLGEVNKANEAFFSSVPGVTVSREVRLAQKPLYWRSSWECVTSLLEFLGVKKKILN